MGWRPALFSFISFKQNFTLGLHLLPEHLGRHLSFNFFKVLFFFKKIINPAFTNIYLFVAVLGLAAVHRVSLVVASGGSFLFVVYRLPTAGASLVVDHWL